MASPPFNPNEAVPGDNDFASQYPAVERTFRDVIESWLLVNHNNLGRHDKIDLDFQDPAPDGIDDVGTIYIDADGVPRIKIHSLTTAQPFGVPTGTILDFAGTTAPEGYLACYGQAVSRTTYANLFAVISTIYGAGDLSTTFNLPDLRGRVAAGQDDMGGTSANRLTGVTGSLDGDTLGATGGEETKTLLQANLPNVNLDTTIAAGQGEHNHEIQSQALTANNGTFQISYGNGAQNGFDTYNATLPEMTGTTPTGGSDTPIALIQPTIIINKIIKV